MLTLQETMAGFANYLPTDLGIHILRNAGIRPELTGYYSGIDATIQGLLEEKLGSIGHTKIALQSLGHHQPGNDRKYPYLYRFYTNDTDQDWLKNHFTKVKKELHRTLLRLGLELYFLPSQPGFIFVRLTPKYHVQEVTELGKK